jgi:hypothetical protein
MNAAISAGESASPYSVCGRVAMICAQAPQSLLRSSILWTHLPVKLVVLNNGAREQ